METGYFDRFLPSEQYDPSITSSSGAAGPGISYVFGAGRLLPETVQTMSPWTAAFNNAEPAQGNLLAVPGDDPASWIWDGVIR